MGVMENDPLATYLDALARDDGYRVDRVLKSAPCEVTEVVFFVSADGSELGPFVRKRIAGEAGLGAAYYQLRDAQRAGRRFRHLPRIYDVHEADGELVVIMEYVEGRTLRDEVFERDPSPALAQRWFPPLCDGVSELHGLFAPPLIHRDLKPSNVLVAEGALTIIDFGIARTWREGADADTAHFGTRAYAPPEQFGYGQTDERTDVYALGMILYYLLTERDPSPAVAREGFADPAVPAPLRPVLQRACAFDPAARYGSAAELKEAFLAASVAACPVDIPPSERPVVPEPSAALPARGFVGRVHRAFAQVTPTEIGGLVWDSILTAVWLLFVGVSFYNPFVADGYYTTWPFWLVMLQYGLFGTLFFTGFYLMLLDVRVVRRFLLAHPRKRSWPVRLAGLCLVVLGIAAVLVTSGMAVAMGLPTTDAQV
ncbi:serine/threonine-protein kinase [uncultured Adlercreutzia sp.]|uniref:serine/threonine protein kinase n=1 Tax=uncultured Adlercreutzia sp. TaxID=875803 RepID=UPI0025FC5010|nr:serine/threonine-protein kinase [uncultured Adlercreutzia sp.]